MGQLAKVESAADVTDAHIKKWKADHGRVFLIEVEDKQGYFKKPERKVVSAATKFMQQGSPIKFQETLVKNCFLGGDRELIDVDEYFYGAALKVEEIIEIKEAELKEL